MITGELKSKIDKIWDTLWTGGISSPTSALEQITYLMFMKLLDDNEIKKRAMLPLLELHIKVRFSRRVNSNLMKKAICLYHSVSFVGVIFITMSLR